MLDLGGCCKFSLDAEGRTPARGTGSLESRGIPLGLEVFVDSMINRDCARGSKAVFKNCS